MMRENTLATVRCSGDPKELLSLLDSCGLRGKVTDDSDVIDIVNGGRLDEADVDRELITLAFAKMEIARVHGRLPEWSRI